MVDTRVVVIGAGFGGLAVARALRDEPVGVTIVDANNFHTFQPLLYQVATAGLDANDVAMPVRGIVRRGWSRLGGRRPTVVVGTVVGIDPSAQEVELDDGRRLGWDVLVVAAGSVSDDFGVPGVDDHAFALKTLEDALEVRRHVLATFERLARREQIPEGALDVVVCGGGPTGVEMAGGLAELYQRVLAADFPELPVGDAQIVLVEGADRVLPPFTPESSNAAADALRRLGVTVRTDAMVARVEPTHVELTDGSRIPAATCVWATGVRANPLASVCADALGVELGPGGRLPVDDQLRVGGHDHVHAIGDIAAVAGADGRPLPQVAQPAIQEGRYLADLIVRRRTGRPVEPFAYVDKGSMATIGRHDAVVELSTGHRLKGLVGWVAWLGLHLVYLMGFRNRVSVFVNWAWNYVTFDRSSRLLGSADIVDHSDLVDD